MEAPSQPNSNRLSRDAHIRTESSSEAADGGSRHDVTIEHEASDLPANGIHMIDDEETVMATGPSAKLGRSQPVSDSAEHSPTDSGVAGERDSGMTDGSGVPLIGGTSAGAPVLCTDSTSAALTQQPPVRMSIAYASETGVAFAVDTSMWHLFNPPLSVKADNYRQRKIIDWASDYKVFECHTVPDVRIFYAASQSPDSQLIHPKVFAVEVLLENFQVTRDLNAAMERAIQGHEEYEREIPRAVRAGIITFEPSVNPAATGSSARPTLLAVLSALLNENITTPAQREQINSVVFAFLQNELSLRKLYSHLAQITGYSTLRSVVRAIDSHRAASGAPASQEYSIASADGHLRREVPHPLEIAGVPSAVAPAPAAEVTSLGAAAAAATGGAAGSGSEGAVGTEGMPFSATGSHRPAPIQPATGLPAPQWLFASKEELTSFFVFNPRAPAYLRESSEAHKYPFWIDLPSPAPIPRRVGHHLIENGCLWLITGGVMMDSTGFSFNPPASRDLMDSPMANGWSQLTIVNPFDFKTDTRPVSGADRPTAAIGSTVECSGDFQSQGIAGDALVVFGGARDPDLLVNFTSSSDTAESIVSSLTNDLHIMDLQNMRWSRVPKSEDEPWPSPRAFHSSGLVLREIPESPDECEMVGMFICGGLGFERDTKQPKALDDIWYLDLTLGTWTEVTHVVRSGPTPTSQSGSAVVSIPKHSHSNSGPVTGSAIATPGSTPIFIPGDAGFSPPGGNTAAGGSQSRTVASATDTTLAGQLARQIQQSAERLQGTFGAAIAVGGFNQYALHGGYTLNAEGQLQMRPGTLRVLSVKLNEQSVPVASLSLVLIDEVPGVETVQRALHTAVVVCVEPTSIKSHQLGMYIQPPHTGMKNMLLLMGGVTGIRSQFETITCLDLHVSKEGVIDRARLVRTVVPQVRPFARRAFTPWPRQMSSITFFHCFSPVASVRPKPPVPAFFVHGGVPVRDNTHSIAKLFSQQGAPVTNTERDPIPSWIISIPAVDPFELNWFVVPPPAAMAALSTGTGSTGGLPQGGASTLLGTSPGAPGMSESIETSQSASHYDKTVSGRGPRGSKKRKGSDQAKSLMPPSATGSGLMEGAGRIGAGFSSGPVGIDDSDGLALNFLKRKRGAMYSDSQEVCRLFVDHLRHSAAWLCGLNFSPGIFQALGSLIAWPFSTIGNLVENAVVLSTRATHISVDFGVAGSDGSLYLSVTDNGRGLTFTTFNKALKRFGNWDGPMERKDSTRAHPTLHYGMGMKFAFARLGEAALIVSRTKGTVGVSLFSQRLHFFTDSQTVSCPGCFWRLPSRDTVYPEQEHWKHQQKIQQFSPFTTPAALVEQINTLGPHPGTRIVFFDHKRTYPVSLAMDPHSGRCFLSSAPAESLYVATSDSISTAMSAAGPIPPSNEYAQLAEKGLVPLDKKVETIELTGMDTADSGHRGNSQQLTPPPRHGLPPSLWAEGDTEETEHAVLVGAGIKRPAKSYRVTAPSAPVTSGVDQAAGLVRFLEGTLADGKEDKTTSDTIADESSRLVTPTFPCWTSARESIDYSLATYLYWSSLFSPAIIWHAGQPLLPLDVAKSMAATETLLLRASSPGVEDLAEAISTDAFQNSTYRWLKQRLNAMVELDYLFHPGDAQADAFGLLGFLNPLESLVVAKSSGGTGSTAGEGKDSKGNDSDGSPKQLQCYETGILLYYKERLIKRLFVPFPAPAELLDRFGRQKFPRSHFQGKPVFMFPCTGIIHVPDWLYPTASREDFAAARSPLFDDFVYKLKQLVASYLSVCLEPAKLRAWVISRAEMFVAEIGKSRPLSPYLHMALLKTAANDPGATGEEETPVRRLKSEKT